MSIFHFRNEKRTPTFGEQFSSGLIKGQERSQKNAQELNKIRLSADLKSKQKMGDIGSNTKTQETLGKYFGSDVAEIWPHLTDGGKTELFKRLMIGSERGENVNQIVSQYFKTNPEEAENLSNNLEHGETSKSNESDQGLISPPADIGLSGKSREELVKKELEQSEKYLGEVRDKYNRAQKLSPIFDELEETVQAGGADALSWGNLADVGNKIGGFLGTTLNSIGKANESGDTGRFRTLTKNLLDQMKEIFGGQIRVKELEVFLTMLPEIGKSKEANLAAIDVLKRMSTASSMFYETAQEIIDKNDGKIPRSLADHVQKKLAKPLKDLASDISSVTKRYQKSSTPKKITKNIANQLLQEAEGDKELARKLAKDRGYRL